MISSVAVTPSSSWYSTASPVVVRVEKATSEFLTGPDWAMNIDICDIINSNHWVAKDVLKAVKKRLQNKNPKVQLLSLTLLETIVKNCADFVHLQIAERSILSEMVKIVKKTMDTRVRDKVLILLDSWQEAFGGPGGKYPQYYWAYQELKLAGVGFPPRSYNAPPIFTPPVSRLVQSQPQLEYGTPSNSSTRLDGTVAADRENLSFSTISSMRSILDLLAEMLQAVNPGDRAAVKDEVIVDLVDRCRANQKKLVDMLTTTGEEGLLAQGLELNDILQNVLAKHDDIASGAPLPIPVTDIKHPSTESRDVGRPDTSHPEPDAKPLVPVTPSCLDEEEDDKKEDDFAQLSQRHSKASPAASQIGEGEPSDPAMSALIVLDPPEPTKPTKEQDIIELLSITLSSTMSPDTPETTPPHATSAQNTNQTPASFNPYSPDSYPAAAHQTQQAFNGYVATWAQQPQPQMQTFAQPSMWQQSNGQFQYQFQPHQQPPSSQFPQNSSVFTPPWAPTPGYFSHSNSSFTPHYVYSTPQTATSPSSPFATSSSQFNSFSAINGNAQVSASTTTTSSSPGQKPFIPSYRLFEDLNVLGKGDQNFKTTGNPSYSLYGANTQR